MSKYGQISDPQFPSCQPMTCFIKNKFKGEEDKIEDLQHSNFLVIFLQISYLKDFSDTWQYQNAYQQCFSLKLNITKDDLKGLGFRYGYRFRFIKSPYIWARLGVVKKFPFHAEFLSMTYLYNNFKFLDKHITQ